MSSRDWRGRPALTRPCRPRPAGERWGTSSPATTCSTSRASPRWSSLRPTPMLDRPCREVLFSDGQRVVADADHSVGDGRQERPPHGRSQLRMRTTDEIATDEPGERRAQSPRAARGSCPTRLAPSPIAPTHWRGSETRPPRRRSLHDGVVERVSGDRSPVRRFHYRRTCAATAATARTRDPRSRRMRGTRRYRPAISG